MKKRLFLNTLLFTLFGSVAIATTSCNIITSEHIFNINVYNEANKGRLYVTTLANENVTQANPGQDLLVKFDRENSDYTLNQIFVNDIEINFDDNLLAYKFSMPFKDVNIRATYNLANVEVTINHDSTKTAFHLEDTLGNTITKVPVYNLTILKYELIDLRYRVSRVDLDGKELIYSNEYNGYPFEVSKSSIINVSYEEVKCNLTVTTNVLGDVISNPDLAFDFKDVAIIYSLWNGDTKLNESDYNGSNAYNDLVPGTELFISTADNMYSQSDFTLSKVTLNGENIPFTTGEDMGVGLIYTFSNPTFVVPVGDAELHFEFTAPEKVNATVKTTNGAEISVIDPNMGSSVLFNGGSVNKNELLMLDAFIPDGYVLDDSTSGAYDADGNLIGEWVSGEYGIAMTFTPTVDFEIVLNCLSILEKEGLTGSFVATEAINDSSVTKNSLTINKDYSFNFFMNGASSYAIEGTLTIPNEVGGAYTWQSVDGKETLSIAPHYEVKGEGTNATSTLRWINVMHRKNISTNYFAFTQGSYTTVSHRVNTNKNEMIAFVSSDFESYGAWLLADEKGLREIKIPNAPVAEDTWTWGEIYDVIDGSINTQLQFKSNKLNYPSALRGSYTIANKAEQVVLDGFGNYTRPNETGTYEFDNLKNVILLHSTTGQKSKWNIDLEGKTLSAYIPTKNALSDIVYKFETIDTDIMYGSKATLSFVDSDTFSLKDYRDIEFAKSYKLERNALTLITTKGTTTLTLDPITLSLIVTGKAGDIFTKGDLPFGTTLAPTALGRTFTTADGTTSITLKTDGTLGETTPYTLKIVDSKVIAETADNLYELDLSTNIFKDITPHFDWAVFNGKTFKGTAVLNTVDMEWNPISGNSKVTITFNADATKADVSIHQEDPEPFGDPYDYESTALAVTIDQQAKTITIALSETKNLVLNVNTKTNEITTAASSVKLYDTTGSEKEFGLEGLSLALPVNYKTIVAGKSFGADVVWEYQDWNDPYAEPTSLTNSITVAFHATNNTADVTMSQTPFLYGGNDEVKVTAGAYTIDDTGLIDINLNNNYKHLKIQIGTDGSLKINGSSLNLKTSEGDIEFGLNNSVLIQK